MKIYLNKPDRTACSYHRAELPTRHLAAPLAKDGISLTCAHGFSTEDYYDAYVFHRVLQPDMIPVLDKLKRRGKKIVIELDDDLWNIPDWNPASSHTKKPQIELAEHTLKLADQVWVSTPSLKEVVPCAKEKVKVLPNLIDTNDYPNDERPDNDRVTIIWAGSIHHEEDVNLLVEPVKTLIAMYGEKVEFLFFGYWPEGLSEWVRIRNTNLATSRPKKELAHALSYCDPVDLKWYPKTLCSLCPDIGLCPLVPHKFNESKSNIKFLEYTLSGAAVVASDVMPYRCIEDGCTGRLVRKEGDWVPILSELIDDTLRRKELAESARKKIAPFTWQDSEKHRSSWLDAFKSLAG